MNREDLIRALKRVRLATTDESALSAAVREILDGDAGADEFRAEAVIGRGQRCDFLLADGTAVELKVKGPMTKVLRQLHRYAECRAVESVLLVSTKATHRPPVKELGIWRKPLYFVHVGARL